MSFFKRRFYKDIEKRRHISYLTAAIMAAAITATLTSCTSNQLRLKDLAKSDINFVADAHITEINSLLKTLMLKLYKRNPRELKKNHKQSLESRRAEIFLHPGRLAFEELGYREDIEAILLTFDEEYQGDRVFALMAGLTGMIRKSYNNKTEFFLIDDLDQQRLYNSARNIEILVWRLNNRRDSKDDLFLLTNSRGGEVSNLSFERIFGKMIAIQDMMAQITADKNKRSINKIVLKLASAAFIP